MDYQSFVRVLLVMCITLAHQGFAAELRPVPDFIHVCKGNDPHLNDCIVRSIQALRPLLATGIPEMEVPSMEPLDVGNLLVSKRTTANGLQVLANDIKAYNASQYEVLNMNVVEHGHIYKFDVSFKTMYVTGKYSIDGQILLLPIRGSGKFNGTFVDAVSSNVVVFGKRTGADGVEYTRVEKVETHIKLKQGKINLQNLFDGDRVLGDVINETINQNFALVAEDLIPLVEKALNKMFKRIGNKVCGPFAWEQFFPDK